MHISGHVGSWTFLDQNIFRYHAQQCSVFRYQYPVQRACCSCNRFARTIAKTRTSVSTVRCKTLWWPCCTASAEWNIIVVSASSCVHAEKDTTSARGGTERISWPTVVSNCFPHINSPSPDTDQESGRVPSCSRRFSETAASYVALDLWHELFFWFLAHGLIWLLP